MGQPAFSNAFVRFDTHENASKAELEFHKWIRLANDHLLPEPAGADKKGSINGDYGISSVDCDENTVTFIVESPRYQNCVWQCENVRDFFVTQPGVESVEMDVMTCEESVNWYKE